MNNGYKFANFLAKLHIHGFLFTSLLTIDVNIAQHSFLNSKIHIGLSFFSFITYVKVDAVPNLISISNAAT